LHHKKNKEFINSIASIRENSDDIRQTVDDEYLDVCQKENEIKKKKLIQNACATEAWYISLSLFAKSFLALTIYVGINMQPN
jgi:hypothetical protein